MSIKGVATTTVAGTIHSDLTGAGLSGTTAETRVDTWQVPHAWSPISELQLSNARQPSADTMQQIIAAAMHLRGRHCKQLLAKRLDAATLETLAGPTTIAALRWTASPAATYVVIRARCRSLASTSTGLSPRLRINSDSATDVEYGHQSTAISLPATLEIRKAITPGATTTLTVQTVDKLAIQSLRVTEEQRDDFGGDVDSFIAPERALRGQTIDVGLVSGLYTWVKSIFLYQQPPLMAWSLDETATGLTLSNSSHQNVLDTGGSTSWSWKRDTYAARGWVVNCYHKGYGLATYSYGLPAVRITTTNATTVRFASSQGTVDISCAGGLTDSWQVAGSSLPLPTALEHDLVQVFASTGGAAATISGLILEGAGS